jgi:hypothetical protein
MRHRRMSPLWRARECRPILTDNARQRQDHWAHRGFGLRTRFPHPWSQPAQGGFHRPDIVLRVGDHGRAALAIQIMFFKRESRLAVESPQAIRFQPRDNHCMALKAILFDKENIQHLVIGLNRENVDSLLRGDVFTLPPGPVPALTENKSDIILLFAETDEELGQRLPPTLRPS